MAIGVPLRMSSLQRVSELSIPSKTGRTLAPSEAGHGNATPNTHHVRQPDNGTTTKAASSSAAPAHNGALHASHASRAASQTSQTSCAASLASRLARGSGTSSTSPPDRRSTSRTADKRAQSLPHVQFTPPETVPQSSLLELASVPPTRVTEELPSRRSPRLHVIHDLTPPVGSNRAHQDPNERSPSSSVELRSLSEWYASQDDQALSPAVASDASPKKHKSSHVPSEFEISTVGGAASERYVERWDAIRLTRASLATLGETSFPSEPKASILPVEAKLPYLSPRIRPTEEFDIASRSPNSSVSPSRHVHRRLFSGAEEVAVDQTALLRRIAKLESIVNEDNRVAWDNISWTTLALGGIFAYVAYHKLYAR
eukprot:GEMP01003772.1.p1 GENE.GEMP01003772.1~~GEMP01003772.1.p1  ORF type:complete len:371 (+),score=72.72 GEMP01003772.1:445-1557(+)